MLFLLRSSSLTLNCGRRWSAAKSSARSNLGIRTTCPAADSHLRANKLALPLNRSAFNRRRRRQSGHPCVFLVEASAASTALPQPERKFDSTKQLVRAFSVQRLLVFFSIVVGYSCYYLTRNSLGVVSPLMVASPDLNLDVIQVGAITSIFPICYGMSKFVSGVVGDLLSPRYMLCVGLFATGVINVAFGFGSTLTWFCTFWAFNGLFQGFGAPSCAKIISAWFATKERGTYWGLWNIAHNLGGALAPILAGAAATALGWKYGLWAPGVVGISMGVILLTVCRDTPTSVGFPSSEDVFTAKQELKGSMNPVTEQQITKTPVKADTAPEKKLTLKENLFQNVLSNPYIWLLAFTYFCIYIVRQGMNSWTVFYLIDAKGVEDAGKAALRVSGFELGGLAGSLLAGKISDYVVGRAPKTAGIVGMRVKVVMVYTVCLGLALLAFRASPVGVGWLQTAAVFMIGFFLYGPQMLVGLCGAEIVGLGSVGASEGFLGWVAYLGAANAGIPLSILVKQFGWDAYFALLIGACILALVLLAPMVNTRSFVQRESLQSSQ